MPRRVPLAATGSGRRSPGKRQRTFTGIISMGSTVRNRKTVRWRRPVSVPHNADSPGNSKRIAMPRPPAPPAATHPAAALGIELVRDLGAPARVDLGPLTQ